MLPSLNALRAFECVARRNSFTQAAAELSISQTAVSHQIKNLEVFLQQELFIRKGSSIELTENGQKLFEGLRTAFELVRISVDEISSAAADFAIGISIRPHFATRWLAPRMASLWLQHPGLNLRFFHSHESPDFSNSDIHIGIIWQQIDKCPKGAIKLRQGYLTPACAPSLLQGAQPINEPVDMLSQVLLFERNDRCWDDWFALADLTNLKLKRKIFYEDTNVRQGAALAGEGIALVDPYLVKEEVQSGSLVCPFPSISLETFSYYLIVPKKYQTISQVEKFTSWIKRVSKSNKY